MISGTALAADVLLKIEIDSTDATRWDVYGALNEAQRDLINILPSHFLPVKTAAKDITSGVYLYQFPDDLVQRDGGLVHAWINGYEARILRVHEHVNQLSLDRQPSAFYPVVWLRAERGYDLLPHPTSSVTDGQLLSYVYQLPVISASQPSLFDANLRNLLVYRAATSAALNEAKKADVAKACYEMYKQELAKYIKA
jgi:hypothetical protein